MKNTIRVYDTIHKKYIELEVSEEIRIQYNRTKWNIENNDRSFYDHEIQISALKGSHENAFENFKEFKTEYDSVFQAS